MKRIYLILAILVFSTWSYSQETTLWDFPVKPGSKKWNSLQNSAEMVSVCQIPQNILRTISTDHLLSLCLNYPLLNDIYAFNNPDTGLQKLFRDFNGIRELFSRNDFGKKMLDKYSSALNNHSLLESKPDSYTKGDYIVSLSTLELLIFWEELQNRIPKTLQKEMMKELWRGYEMKQKKQTYFQGVGFKTNLWARGKTISSMEKSGLKETINLYDPSCIEHIDKKGVEPQ